MLYLLYFYQTSLDQNQVYIVHFGKSNHALTVVDVIKKQLYSALVDLPVNNTDWYNSPYGPFNFAGLQKVVLSDQEYFIGVGGTDGFGGMLYNVYFVDESTVEPTKVLRLKSTCNLPGFWPAIWDTTSRTLITIAGIYYVTDRTNPYAVTHQGYLDVTACNMDTGIVTVQKFSDRLPIDLYKNYVNIVVGVVVPVGVVVICIAIVVPIVVVKRRKRRAELAH